MRAIRSISKGTIVFLCAIFLATTDAFFAIAGNDLSQLGGAALIALIGLVALIGVR
jgi:hypothetical protein